jgi:voltage-gated potassium channel
MKLRSRIRDISDHRNDNQALIRLMRAAGLQAGIFVVGTTGYYTLGKGDYTLLDAAYMTVITLTTVGFEEVIPIKGDPGLELFTILLLIIGMGAVLYFVSSITAFIVDGELRDLLKRRNMNSKIEKMRDHFIIAGMGNTGSHVLPEMLASRREVLVIDRNRESIDRAIDECGCDLPFLVGDATADDCLLRAGLSEASGVIFSLGNDRDNLFATITARQLNPDITIVTRGEDPRSEAKFLRAGATSVIYTNVLGGMRMAAEALRPEVTTFLDIMMNDHGHFRRVEELPVPNGSPVVGKTLRELGIRQYSDALVIAVHDVDDEYHFNPGPDFVIPRDSMLIVLALVDDVPLLEDLIAGRR